MRKYFVVEGFQRKGPFDIEELIQMGISKETLIWTFELGSEKPAGEINELESVFSVSVDIKQPEEQNEKSAPTSDNVKSDEELLAEYEKIKQEQIEKEKAKEEIIQNEIVQDGEESKLENINFSDEKLEEKIEIVKEPEEVVIKEKPNIKKDLNDLVIQLQEKRNETTYQSTSSQNSQNKYQNKEYSSTTFSSVNKGEKPKTYILLAVLSIFCCMPLGIAGLVFSTQVEKKYNEGDLTGSQIASRNALIFSIISLIGGFIFAIIALAAQ